ncbi:MAG: hypothetical protein IKV10_01560, partial [Alphaproteobacteria bacterium]|nr:hypothetical protein [Alphaproteobacteria bacterium]
MGKKIFPASKVQHTLYHYTTKENAEKILRDGFRPASEVKTETVDYTNQFDGIFFTQSEHCYWNDPNLVRIAVKVNMQNPLDISSFPSAPDQYTPEQQKLAQQIEQYIAQGEANHDKIVGNKYDRRVLAIETSKVFQKAGYDGLIFNSNDEHVEHVVFDPKNIQII